MKSIATGAVFVALVMASVSPALAATSRPKADTVDAALVASTVPATLASDAVSSSGTSATSTVVSAPQLYSGLLSFFKADLDFEGAVYEALGGKNGAPASLTAAYGKLNASILSLIDYLSSTTTVG